MKKEKDVGNGFDEQKAQKELEKGYSSAEKLLSDVDSTERFLQRLESKLRTVPLAGETLASVPVLASLLRSSFKKEYTDIPIGSIIAITSALTILCRRRILYRISYRL